MDLFLSKYKELLYKYVVGSSCQGCNQENDGQQRVLDVVNSQDIVNGQQRLLDVGNGHEGILDVLNGQKKVLDIIGGM